VVLRIRKDRTAHDSRSAPLRKPVFLWHAMQNDIDIFRGIKRNIQKNPADFRPAGQWLDDFCQNIVNQAEQRRQKLPQIKSAVLKKIQSKKSLLENVQHEREKLRKIIAGHEHNDEKFEEEKQRLSTLDAEANQLTFNVPKLGRKLKNFTVRTREPGFIQLMSKAFEKASCEYPRNHIKIMVIVWLLTDEYLHKSKIGITKYEQYVFKHEIIEPEGTGLKRTISEQELARDAVLYAEPEAMKIVRDAWAHFQENENPIGTEQSASQKPAETKPEVEPDHSDENKAYIKKERSFWVFGFNGETAKVKFQPDKELKGLALIEFLLIHPNKEYTPLKLLQETGQREKGETEPEKIYTDNGIGQITKAIEGLKGRAELTTEREEKERLEQEIEDAKAILYKTRNCKGKSRKFSEKYTKSVSRNIETVLKKIAPQNVELYNHLDTFLKAGEKCYYKPDTEIFWEISLKTA